jgi:excisionase family DNA binding protein
MTEPTEYLKISEVAMRYNVGSKVVRKLIKDQVIPTIYFGYRTLRIPSDELDMALTKITTGTQVRKERKNNV